MRKFKKGLALILVVFLVAASYPSGLAFAGTANVSDAEIQKALDEGVQYLKNYYSNKDYHGMLEDWAVVGLHAAGADLSKWTKGGKTAKDVILEDLNDENLLKYGRNTDYQRVILSIKALGIDPSSVNGKNYIDILSESQLPSGKFADMVGKETGGENLINAHIWGIIAMSATGNNMEEDKALKWLLDNAKEDGSYSIDVTLEEPDIDMTAMSINAFVGLGLDKDSESISKLLNYLKNKQQASGGFSAWNMETAESAASVIQGLTALGIDAQGDQWSTENGNPITALLQYQLADGSFAHYDGGRANLKATVQAVIALADYLNGETVFQRMSKEESASSGFALTDVSENYWAYSAINNLVADGVIKGYTDNTFRPENQLTRAEFAVILALGLNMQDQMVNTTSQFNDLPLDHWANKAVKVTVDNDLIKGMSAVEFAPNDKITGAQVVTLMVRASGYTDEAEAIKGDKWYSGFVEIAEKYDLTYPDFDPDKPATRAQCAYVMDKVRQNLK